MYDGRCQGDKSKKHRQDRREDGKPYIDANAKVEAVGKHCHLVQAPDGAKAKGQTRQCHPYYRAGEVWAELCLAHELRGGEGPKQRDAN